MNVLELMFYWLRYLGFMSGVIGYLCELGFVGLLLGDFVVVFRVVIEDGWVLVLIDIFVVGGGVGGGGGGLLILLFFKVSRFVSVLGVVVFFVDKLLLFWVVLSDVLVGEFMSYF